MSGTRFSLFFLFAASVAAQPDSLGQRAQQYLIDLIRLNTTNPPGNETTVVNYLREVLDREGIPYKIFAQEPSRANLVARLKGNASSE